MKRRSGKPAPRRHWVHIGASRDISGKEARALDEAAALHAKELMGERLRDNEEVHYARAFRRFLWLRKRRVAAINRWYDRQLTYVPIVWRT